MTKITEFIPLEPVALAFGRDIMVKTIELSRQHGRQNGVLGAKRPSELSFGCKNQSNTDDGHGQRCGFGWCWLVFAKTWSVCGFASDAGFVCHWFA